MPGVLPHPAQGRPGQDAVALHLTLPRDLLANALRPAQLPGGLVVTDVRTVPGEQVEPRAGGDAHRRLQDDRVAHHPGPHGRGEGQEHHRELPRVARRTRASTRRDGDEQQVDRDGEDQGAQRDAQEPGGDEAAGALEPIQLPDGGHQQERGERLGVERPRARRAAPDRAGPAPMPRTPASGPARRTRSEKRTQSVSASRTAFTDPQDPVLSPHPPERHLEPDIAGGPVRRGSQRAHRQAGIVALDVRAVGVGERPVEGEVRAEVEEHAAHRATSPGLRRAPPAPAPPRGSEPSPGRRRGRARSGMRASRVRRDCIGRRRSPTDLTSPGVRAPECVGLVRAFSVTSTALLAGGSTPSVPPAISPAIASRAPSPGARRCSPLVAGARPEWRQEVVLRVALALLPCARARAPPAPGARRAARWSGSSRWRWRFGNALLIVSLAREALRGRGFLVFWALYGLTWTRGGLARHALPPRSAPGGALHEPGGDLPGPAAGLARAARRRSPRPRWASGGSPAGPRRGDGTSACDAGRALPLRSSLQGCGVPPLPDARHAALLRVPRPGPDARARGRGDARRAGACCAGGTPPQCSRSCAGTPARILPPPIPLDPVAADRLVVLQIESLDLEALRPDVAPVLLRLWESATRGLVNSAAHVGLRELERGLPACSPVSGRCRASRSTGSGWDHGLESLPAHAAARGFTFHAYHGNDRNFWNRGPFYLRAREWTSRASESIPETEFSRWGRADGDLFRYVAARIPAERRAVHFLITLSTHAPYDLVIPPGPLERRAGEDALPPLGGLRRTPRWGASSRSLPGRGHHPGGDLRRPSARACSMPCDTTEEAAGPAAARSPRRRRHARPARPRRASRPGSPGHPRASRPAPVPRGLPRCVGALSAPSSSLSCAGRRRLGCRDLPCGRSRWSLAGRLGAHPAPFRAADAAPRGAPGTSHTPAGRSAPCATPTLWRRSNGTTPAASAGSRWTSSRTREGEWWAVHDWREAHGPSASPWTTRVVAFPAGSPGRALSRADPRPGAGVDSAGTATPGSSPTPRETTCGPPPAARVRPCRRFARASIRKSTGSRSYAALRGRADSPRRSSPRTGAHIPGGSFASFVHRAPLLAVTVTRAEAPEACRLRCCGQVPLLTHTVNDPSEAADLMRAGIAGIYTDDLLPE